MKDFNGIELGVGDEVATTYHGYSDIMKFKVVGFTPQKIKLENGKRSVMKFPEQVSYIQKKEVVVVAPEKEWINSEFKEPPILPDTYVDVKFRNDEICYGLTVRSFDWNDHGCKWDIISYRLSREE